MQTSRPGVFINNDAVIINFDHPDMEGISAPNTTPMNVANLQSFASNAEAVAAIGVGKLYQSTTLINGSPIILITV